MSSDILHFKGDRRNFDPDVILGPDLYERRLRIVSVDYDPATDRSTAKLRAVLPPEFRERLVEMRVKVDAYNRIKRLFNG